MALLSFKDIVISGISACVPKNVTRNADFTELIAKESLEKVIKATGIAERRIASSDICASDLCFEAASKLLDEMSIGRASIDMLIFVSQTPDYRLPPTATILQERLGLAKSTGAFDLNLGCSGYVYGLSTAFSYLSSEGINRILLLAGDTLSKFISPKDKATSLLFGDGGTATLIEKRKDSGGSYFSLNSDGAGQEILKVKAGGCRFPSNSETLREKEHENGSIRSDEQMFMDGVEIFNFILREIPGDIANILNHSHTKLEDIDAVVYHQANKMITDYLTKKLKYPSERVPSSLHKFGNTSVLSIPLTIVSELKEKLAAGRHKTILCGFGVGLSWATALLEFSGCHVSDLIEV